MSDRRALFVPSLIEKDLVAEGTKPEVAAKKAYERKKDLRRVEAALESLGVPFKHEKVGTSATMTELEATQLLALLPNHLPSRAGLEISELSEA